MSGIEVKELGEYIPKEKCTISLNKLKEFVNVPYYIPWYFSSESNKVFPLFLQEISDLNPTKWQIPGILTRNPFFDHTQIKYFAAYKNEQPVGRIMVYKDYKYNEFNGGDFGWFGLFESIDDKFVAKHLLETATEYLKQNGCKKVLGPAKFNANGEIGLLIEGFDKKPYFMEPYNTPYYHEFFESFGFEKENDWFSMHTNEELSKKYMEKIENLMKLTKGTKRDPLSNGFVIRNIDFKNIKNEIKIIKSLYNPIWNEGTHPQFVQMTDAEFNGLAAGIKTVALEDLIFIVEKEIESNQMKPIGVSVSVPNINEVINEYDLKIKDYVPSKKFLNFKDLKRDISIFDNMNKCLKEKNFKSMRILILGVEKKYRLSGIDAWLYYETARKALSIGIKEASGSELADINFDITNPLFKMGEKAMTWRVYYLNV